MWRLWRVRGALGTCSGSAHRGGGIQEVHENQRLFPRSQTPAGVGPSMDNAPGKGPSAPGRITERKGKGDFVEFKPILVEGGSFCLQFERLCHVWDVGACDQREETPI